MANTANVFQGANTVIPVVNTNGNIFEEWQIATAAQAVFTLLTFQYTINTKSIFVFKNGVMLRRVVDYTETSGTQITLITPAALNDRLTFIAIGVSQLIVGSGNVPPGGTAGQVLTKISASDYAMAWQSATALASLLDAARQNVASAATLDLSGTIATQTRNINLTGTTAVTGVLITNGQLWACKASGVFTLTNSANLVTQKGADIVLSVGDTWFFRATADNVVEVLCYSSVSAGALVVSSINGGQLAGMRNKIINGGMDIAQRGTSFPATGTAYNLDRFFWSSDAVYTGITQAADAPSNNEFQNSLKSIISTAKTPVVAGTFGAIIQVIEGYNVRDLIGNTFTISFWVKAAKTGIHCISFRNSGNDRSYIAEYTVISANTWEKKSITVTGGLITAGTWNWTNGIGLQVQWILAAGSTFQTTPNAWQVGNFQATANQVNELDTLGNVFAITGIQLEIGTQATPFEHKLFGEEFTSCQRYHQRFSDFLVGGNSAGGAVVFTDIAYPTRMRAIPTAGYIGALTYVNASAGNVNSLAIDRIRMNVVITAAGYGYSTGAVLAIDAEL